jgi:hypothetical protein
VNHIMEQMKHNSEEFGGIQSGRLKQHEIEQRMCCAQFCSLPGFTQIEIPLAVPEEYRVVCRKHYVLIALMVSASIGDPSPAMEAKRVAELINLDWRGFLESAEPKHAVQPENFTCMRCGGGMTKETTGMFAGRRWSHTCGEERIVG